MPLSTEIKDAVYQYCNNHLADEAWYNGEFEFIEDQALRKRLIEEFKGIRFATNSTKELKQRTKILSLKFDIRYFHTPQYTKP